MPSHGSVLSVVLFLLLALVLWDSIKSIEHTREEYFRKGRMYQMCHTANMVDLDIRHDPDFIEGCTAAGFTPYAPPEWSI